MTAEMVVVGLLAVLALVGLAVLLRDAWIEDDAREASA